VSDRSSILSIRVWLVYLVLLLIAVPWYWPDDELEVWAGVPAWVFVSVVASVATSAYTAWLFLTHWDVDKEVVDEVAGGEE